MMKNQYEPIIVHPRLFALDTDIGVDCDDAGALAVLFGAMKKQPLPLGAIVSTSPQLWGCGAVDAIAAYYGVSVPLIGKAPDSPFLAEPRYHVYDRVLAEEYSERYRKGELAVSDGVEAYVRLLESAPSKGMVLICVGPLHLISELWRRAPQLVEEKLEAVVCMGGVYDSFETFGHREYNFFTDAAATKTVFEELPCPIYCIGLELGKAIPAGFAEADHKNPVNRAYEIHTKGRMIRPTWDPLTVLFALEGESDRFVLSEAGRNEITEDGSNFFVPDPNGKHFYVKAKKPYAELINELTALINEAGCTPAL